MRIDDVADTWGISTRTVYRLIERGLLPAEIVTIQVPQDCYDIPATMMSRVEEMLKHKGKTKKKDTTLIREYLTQLNMGNQVHSD